MKKVSVIVPVYNTEEFLEDCLNSLINQTYNNLDILVINNGSTDRSKEIIDVFVEKDKRIHSFDFNSSLGVGAARNYGVSQAEGDYVYFVDSDDYIGKDTLQLLMDNIGDHDIISGKLVNTGLSEEIIHNETQEIDMKLYKKKRKNLFKNKSILNRLISMNFIRSNNLAFPEQVEIFSDIKFIADILALIEEIPYVKQSVYFKRKRNDPITNPSLIQRSRTDKIKNLTKVYMEAKDKYSDIPYVSTYLDQQLLNYYRKTITVHFKNEDNIDISFYILSNAMKEIDSNFLSKKSAVLKREIKPIIENNINKFKRINRQHHRLRNIRKATKSKKSLFLQLYRSFFVKSKMNDKLVVFESFLGKNYSDNPKYIYEYMLNNHMDYKYVWVFNETGKNIPGNAKQVKRFSLAYYYYLAKAKYWVSNTRMPKSLGKREGNVYLQTWHGTPLKTLVFDLKDIYSANPNVKKDFYIQTRRWDYLISPNKYSSEIFRRAFKYDKTMLEFGYPRNDILYTHNDKEKINDLKAKLDLPTNKKIILYAPTWRDDEFFERGKYKFTLKLELDKMKESLKDDYIVILRTHYHIANQIDISGYENFAYDRSRHDDIAELYLVSDILITDYSSVFFDYAHLRRPILFYTYDLEKYRDTIRGLYFDIEKEVPGPLLKTTKSVISAINNIEELNKEYQEKYEAFYNKFCQWDNGSASENVVKQVFHS
ncbi:teichoic acid poly(glycerol phosphate) polymerase [Paraliobacillus ryukyuensis]|uniref:CDP-glycerol glycerophosphotransferase n=1 Tax=Paraliobacillus ryukyuensis TaxID=200904 RepID=A0A366EDU4_9BACI|nr:CDP-glycerol:glycerophosphate glycerophosphotransferase [Paraliobacillus ryukyuensis]RBP00584.1 CDP-glycerol glycerophosphotransferase [Paraliobacillus ryukyuensis]